MLSNKGIYRKDIDAIKGICIIAVVLYHMGFLKSGYLGVDAFFVINGYFIIPILLKKISEYDFSYLSFIKKRLNRLLPLVTIVSLVALLLGYFLMLPDDYENLAQSVIASNMMSENVLSAFTTKNYWDISNEYKPLMHLWYVGVLFEFYITFPLVLLLLRRCFRSQKNLLYLLKVSTLVLFVISLFLYLLPIDSYGNKFYCVHYRYFELLWGGIIGLLPYTSAGNTKLKPNILFGLGLVSIIFMSLFSVLVKVDNTRLLVVGTPLATDSGLPINGQAALIMTVLFAGLSIKGTISLLCKSRILPVIGKMSYSLFVWHQLILAFYRYSISDSLNCFASVLYLTIVFSISVLSYFYIENRMRISTKSLYKWVAASVVLMIPSVYVYVHSGVIRDVPELDIKKGNEHRGMFGEYCDRIYQYKDFPVVDNHRSNVLVVGISFGRDFANVLLESEFSNKINLAYGFTWKDDDIERLVAQADYIFSFSAKHEIPNFVWRDKKKSCKVYGIGTKNFGINNGVIYRNRNSEKYFSQSAELCPGYMELNNKWKKEWGSNYVDMITPAMIDSIHVRVFTDDNKYISQDCRHLTPAGARWYARIINWSNIFD